MKNILFNKELKDARACFIENVSEPCFPWRAAFNSYYCKEDSNELVYEIRVCSELLERKKIDPNSIGTSFAIWKDFN